MTGKCPDSVRQAMFPEMGVLYLLVQAAYTAINALVAANPALAEEVDPPPESAQSVLDCAWDLIQAIDDYERALDRQWDLQLKLYDHRPF